MASNMMMDFLVRRFIKDYENVENAKVRTAYGMLAGITGICCNLLLFGGKLFAGLVDHRFCRGAYGRKACR